MNSPMINLSIIPSHKSGRAAGNIYGSELSLVSAKPENTALGFIISVIAMSPPAILELLAPEAIYIYKQIEI